MKHMFFTLLTLFTFCNSPFILQAYAAAPAPVPKTGQIKCYNTAGTEIPCAGTGQDGDKYAGVDWPNPRFTDNSNGTVTDNLTGLLWSKNANCFTSQTWASALATANNLANGACGLTDSSTAGQWRLPTVKELESLFTATYLPIDHPFSNVQANYWSSSTTAHDTSRAWIVSTNNTVYNNLKTINMTVWPVRSGQ